MENTLSAPLTMPPAPATSIFPGASVSSRSLRGCATKWICTLCVFLNDTSFCTASFCLVIAPGPSCGTSIIIKLSMTKWRTPYRRAA
ncbi:hypothetical protein D9M72_600740 [compost metagenome]